ncbi:LRC15 protein, partial [Pseudoatta argentina]
FLQMKLILFVLTLSLAGKPTLLEQTSTKTISVSSKEHEKKFNIKINKEEKDYKNAINEILNLNGMDLKVIKNDIIKSDAIRDIFLSHNSLKKIPHILDHVIYLSYLNLSHNNINLYEANQIVHPNLRVLDLSNQRVSNVINVIPETEVETFEETEDIYKRLIFNTTKIRLPNLEYLNLCGNDISAFPWDFNLSFPKLIRLDLCKINAIELESNFFNKISTSLRTLHLENNYIHNLTLPNIGEITSLYLDGNILKTLFINSTKLRILSLSNCTKHLSMGVFGTPYLEQLDLSKNDFSNSFDVTVQFEKFPSSLKVLLLDYNKLSHVPILIHLQWLNELSLCYNMIKFIKPNTFIYLTSLTKLSLKGNKIERLEKENFSGLEKLKYLDLSKNQLSYLPIDWATSLLNLQYLNKNAMTIIDYYFMTLGHKFTIFFIFTIVYLAKTQHDKNGIPPWDFKSNFWGITKQRSDDVVDLQTSSTQKSVISAVPTFPLNSCPPHSHVFSFSNVGLQKIGRDFINSNDVVSLSLDNNNINDISPFAFRKMQNLKYLDLSGNNISKEKLLLPRSNNLQTLIIDNNRDSHDPVTEALKEYEVFQNLKHLHLCNSQLRNFQIHFYMATPILTHLYLNNNGISSSDAVFDNIPATLTHLYLNKNVIDQVKQGKLRHLQELSMNDNVITQACFEKCEDKSISLKGAAEMQYLSLARNLISEITSDAFSDTSRLLKLDLSGNKITDITKGTFNKTMMINNLSLANNSLVTVPDVCSIIFLRNLDLSENRITAVFSGTFCINLRTLEYLHLSNNVITTIETRAFRNLLSLKYLDLSGNRLKQLPAHWVYSWYIQELHLERNNFTELDNISLINIKELKNIYLDENPMPVLTAGSFQLLPGHNLSVLARCKIPRRASTLFRVYLAHWVAHMRDHAEKIEDGDAMRMQALIRIKNVGRKGMDSLGEEWKGSKNDKDNDLGRGEAI